MITAGGLVLFAGNDSKLYALDKDTGELICTKDLPNGSLGVPAVYEVNGRQYVLLAVSGGNPFPVGGRLAPGLRTGVLGWAWLLREWERDFGLIVMSFIRGRIDGNADRAFLAE